MHVGIRPPSRYQAPGQDVVLGDDPPARQRPRLALDRDDPVDEHQRLVGQPDPRRMRVDRGELGAEHRADRADGELQALLAIERDLERGSCPSRRSTVVEQRARSSTVGGRLALPVRAPRGLDQGELEFQVLAHQLRVALRDAEERLVRIGPGVLAGEEPLREQEEQRRGSSWRPIRDSRKVGIRAGREPVSAVACHPDDHAKAPAR